MKIGHIIVEFICVVVVSLFCGVLLGFVQGVIAFSLPAFSGPSWQWHIRESLEFLAVMGAAAGVFGGLAAIIIGLPVYFLILRGFITPRGFLLGSAICAGAAILAAIGLTLIGGGPVSAFVTPVIAITVALAVRFSPALR